MRKSLSMLVVIAALGAVMSNQAAADTIRIPTFAPTADPPAEIVELLDEAHPLLKLQITPVLGTLIICEGKVDDPDPVTGSCDSLGISDVVIFRRPGDVYPYASAQLYSDCGPDEGDVADVPCDADPIAFPNPWAFASEADLGEEFFYTPTRRMPGFFEDEDHNTAIYRITSDTVVPEPPTLSLLSVAFGALAFARARYRTARH